MLESDSNGPDPVECVSNLVSCLGLPSIQLLVGSVLHSDLVLNEDCSALKGTKHSANPNKTPTR